MGISLQDAQQVYSNAGLRTQYGLILPPGARVAAYVRSTGVQAGDDGFLATNLVTTLAAGLARCRSGMGDFVVCLPGHVETVTDATTFSGALLAGTRIVGVGRGTNAPTVRFAAAGGRWTVAVNDVLITGLRFQMAGTTAVPSNTTLAISVTADDFAFVANDVEVTIATALATTAINVSGAAARFDISNNSIHGAYGITGAAAPVIISGTGADGRICDNEMILAGASALGLINVTGAVSGLKVLRNIMVNTAAASVSCITFANTNSAGACADNRITVFSTGASVSGTTGITIGAACVVGFFNNLVVNDPLTSGKLLPTVDT